MARGISRRVDLSTAPRTYSRLPTTATVPEPVPTLEELREQHERLIAPLLRGSSWRSAHGTAAAARKEQFEVDS